MIKTGSLHLAASKGELLPVKWINPIYTCDLDKVRLQHLDGSALRWESGEEYDRMHRFIRLWRKLGWTIDEVDKALEGLAKKTVRHRKADNGDD